MVHRSLSLAPTILCCFSDWLSKCAETPDVTFIHNKLRSCRSLTMLWQHDENVMLERSVCRGSQSVWGLFLCLQDSFLPPRQGVVTHYQLFISFFCPKRVKSTSHAIHQRQALNLKFWLLQVLLVYRFYRFTGVIVQMIWTSPAHNFSKGRCGIKIVQVIVVD